MELKVHRIYNWLPGWNENKNVYRDYMCIVNHIQYGELPRSFILIQKLWNLIFLFSLN